MNCPKDAIEAYRAGLAIDSTIPEAHYDLGNALARVGNTAETESQFEEAVRLDDA